MAASDSTVREVVRVVREHVDAKTFFAILDDLLKVDGNASFRQTIAKMWEEAQRQG